MGRTSRKDEIKDALKALASECPYDKITIEEIASKSGLNRKTFYSTPDHPSNRLFFY